MIRRVTASGKARRAYAGNRITAMTATRPDEARPHLAAPVSALKDSGAEEISVEDGRHDMLLFSIQGRKASPIIISKTPPDRFGRVNVAADTRREFNRLGLMPPLRVGSCFGAFTGSIGWGRMIAGYVGLLI